MNTLIFKARTMGSLLHAQQELVPAGQSLLEN